MDPDPASHPFLALLFQAAPGAPIDQGAFLVGIVVLLLLLFASALFSGSEVALFSLNEQARSNLAARNDRASRRVLRLLEEPRQLLVTILILNTSVNVAAAILSALLTGVVAEAQQWNPALTVVLEVVVLTFVLLVLSEISPKLIATRNAVAFSRRVSGLILVLHRVLFPISNLLARSTQALHRRLKPNLHRRISTEDLKAMADVGEANGTLEEAERELIYSIVEFGETTVREIMVSRLDMVALPVTASLGEAFELIRESGHSRLPLYIDHLDNILGVVYAKDLLPYLRQKDETEQVDWTRIARPAIFVPLGKKLDDLLKDFQTRKTHIAVVVDEYGGTAGLVTLEDVLEEIVGDIRDEHDEDEEELYQQLDPHTYRFDARINLDDLNDVLHLDLDTEAYDFETLGGLVFHLTGAIPKPGETMTFENLHLQVETVENHRIGSVLVRVQPKPVPEELSERREA